MAFQPGSGFALYVDNGVQAIVNGAGAANGATSIPVVALTGAIINGTVLTFSNGRTATVTVPANIGNTTLTVSALGGPIPAGEWAVVSSFVLVNGMNKYARKSNRDETRFPIFQGATLVAQGDRAQSFSVSGFLNDTDVGQQKLRSVEAVAGFVKVQILFDGTHGFTQTVYVNSFSHDATATGLQEHGFEMTPLDVAVAVSGGPVL